ncbi:MAG: signal peptide protein [Clostridiales bacterium]|nr:signal peptide protein [Clostridiales bacterium]
MKKKVLACVLACAMLFLGMGYAYWTDSLQIDTAVTTGELNVKFVDLAIYGQYDGADHETGWAIVDGIGNTGVTPNWYFDRDTSYNIITDPEDLTKYYDRQSGYTTTTFDAWLTGDDKLPKQVGPYTTSTKCSDTIEIELGDIYPGFAQVFQSDIVNVGTLAAKLKNIKLTVTNCPNPEMEAMIGVNLKLLREYAGTPDEENHVPVFKTADLTPADTFDLAGVTFIRLSSLKTLLAGNEALINNEIYVYPDDNRMDLYIGIAMDPDKEGNYTTGWTGDLKVGKDDSFTQGKTANFNFQFLWDQFNVDNPGAGGPAHGQL